jgi:GDP-4-dehydro-6-deoxy-D-mannose reductase
MRAFVTGLDGFVGQWLARDLLGAGVELAGGSRVVAPSYSILTPDEANAIAWSCFELHDQAALEKAIRACRPDAVYHLAAQAFVGESLSSPMSTFETNVLGTARVLEAVKNASPEAFVLYVGSADAYGPVSPSDLPLRESAPLAPTNPYGASKAAAEAIVVQYARAGMLRTAATRSFNHTGPGQRPLFAVSGFAKQIAYITRGQQPPVLRVGNLDARRDYSDVRDVVRAYRLIADAGSSGSVYNVCAGKSVAMREIVDELIGIAGIHVSIEVDPARMRPSDTPDLVGDNTSLTTDTGWRPTISLAQTLRDVYAWHAQVPLG